MTQGECCALKVIEPVIADYDASIGELVQVDMTGYTAPKVLSILLPMATPVNKGLPVVVVTINSGGAENGSVLRIRAPNQIILPTANQFVDTKDREVMMTLTSNGHAWVITSNA